MLQARPVTGVGRPVGSEHPAEPAAGSSPSSATVPTPARSPRFPRLRFPGSASRVCLLMLAAAGLVAAYLFVDLPRAWEYVLPLRAAQVGGMIVVAVAIGIATVLFQTVTDNRILTPSLMGFDALYVLSTTAVFFVWGGAATTGGDTMAVLLRFASDAGIMTLFAVTLFLWLLRRGRSDVHLVLLVGIVLGVLFRSISAVLQRAIDPGEFQVLQDRLFASFTDIDRTLLPVAAVVVVLAVLPAWLLHRRLDVIALGRDTATGLGVDHRRHLIGVLVIVSVLVSAATALVGPVTFFGLLVAHLAYRTVGAPRHALVLPAVCAVGVIALVGGQMLLARAFGFDTSLSIIIEFLGGLVFILILLREARP